MKGKNSNNVENLTSESLILNLNKDNSEFKIEDDSVKKDRTQDQRLADNESRTTLTRQPKRNKITEKQVQQLKRTPNTQEGGALRKFTSR
jgi:hypothetical protein